MLLHGKMPVAFRLHHMWHITVLPHSHTSSHSVPQVVPIGHVLEGAAEQSVYLGVRLPRSAAESPSVVLLPDTPLARYVFLYC